MKRTLTGLVLIAMLAPAPLAAAKDRDDDSGPYNISREQAIEIARQNGMAEIRETDRDDGLWEIEGHDANGDKLEIEISGQTGEIVKLETYGAGHHGSHGEHHRSGGDDSGHHSGHHD